MMGNGPLFSNYVFCFQISRHFLDIGRRRRGSGQSDDFEQPARPDRSHYRAEVVASLDPVTQGCPSSATIQTTTTTTEDNHRRRRHHQPKEAGAGPTGTFAAGRRASHLPTGSPATPSRNLNFSFFWREFLKKCFILI